MTEQGSERESVFHTETERADWLKAELDAARDRIEELEGAGNLLSTAYAHLLAEQPAKAARLAEEGRRRLRLTAPEASPREEQHDAE